MRRGGGGGGGCSLHTILPHGAHEARDPFSSLSSPLPQVL